MKKGIVIEFFPLRTDTGEGIEQNPQAHNRSGQHKQCCEHISDKHNAVWRSPAAHLQGLDALLMDSGNQHTGQNKIQNAAEGAYPPLQQHLLFQKH
ncbi:hypothetical protein D3C74_323170 [compost metagenome]